MGIVVRQFAAVADFDDDEAMIEARNTVAGRVRALVDDKRHGPLEFRVVPHREESHWRGLIGTAGDGTPESIEARDGLIAYMASNPKAALVVCEARLYGTQQRSKASLS